MNYLFKNCYLPFEEKIRDIYVEDGYITRIDSDIDGLFADKIIDIENRILFNGFVDSHMHLDKALIGEKVFNKSGTLKEAIGIMSTYKKSMTKKDIKDRARQTLKLSYNHGTRFLRTHVDVDEIIGLKGLEAILELKEEYEKLIQIQVVAFPQEGFLNNPSNYNVLEESLKLGADIVGGIPANENDPIRHIDMIFELAKKYCKDIDMHIDETDDPDTLTLKYLAEKTLLEKYQKRVTADHCCSLSANKLEYIENLLSLTKKAEINIITLPSTNLYLQGRDDKKNFRRGITRVKDLLEREIAVSIGSDNIRDPFNPFGNGNLMEEALIAAHGCHMGGLDDLDKIFEMTTIIPSSMFKDYAVQEKQKAKFVVLDTDKKHKAIVNQTDILGYFSEEDYIWNY